MEGLNEIVKLQEELQIVNQKLLNAEKVKSDFLSNIKNEINNPLTSVLGLLKVATGNPDDVGGNAKITQLVYKEIYNLNFQMRNILTAAEIEAGQALINVSKFNLNELVHEVTTSLTGQEEALRDSVDIEVGSEEIFVTDREKMSIILSNLLSNALKFSKSEKNVIVRSTYDESDNLVLSVVDFGVGISKADLNLVFDRFKQLDSGTRKEFGGHGLGLAVVHSLVSMLNGTFTLNSEEGKGTVFIVTVPPIGEFQSESVFYDDDEGILFGQDEDEEELF